MNKTIKSISLLLVAAMLWQDVCMAAPLDSFPALSPSFSLQLPAEIGHVAEIHKGRDGRMLVHIQDAHMNLSAQQNLAKILEILIQKHGLNTVFMEGATEDDSLTSLRSLAEKEIRERVGKEFLMRGEINGAEYLNLSSDYAMRIWGVEQPELYRKNLEQYAAVAGQREAALDYLAEITKRNESLKRRLYAKEALDFDAFVSRFEKKEISFSDYFGRLAEESRKLGINLFGYPDLLSLGRLKSLEDKINFTKANAEQAELVRLLMEGESASPIEKLKAESLTPLSFYESLFERASEKKIDPSDYSNLKAYVDYLRAYEKIDLKKVLEESAIIRREIFSRNLSDPDAFYLYEISESLKKAKSLFSLQITKAEFDEYAAEKSQRRFETSVMLGFMNRKFYTLGSAENVMRYEPILENALKDARAFYETTQARDERFIAEAMRKMDTDKLKIAVLVTGGYHTPNLKRLFDQNGLSYAVLAPHVENETNLKRYEEVLFGPLGKDQAQLNAAAAGQTKLLNVESAGDRGVLSLIASQLSLASAARLAGTTYASKTTKIGAELASGKSVDDFWRNKRKQILLLTMGVMIAGPKYAERISTVSGFTASIGVIAALIGLSWLNYRFDIIKRAKSAIYDVIKPVLIGSWLLTGVPYMDEAQMERLAAVRSAMNRLPERSGRGARLAFNIKHELLISVPLAAAAYYAVANGHPDWTVSTTAVGAAIPYMLMRLGVEMIIFGIKEFKQKSGAWLASRNFDPVLTTVVLTFVTFIWGFNKNQTLTLGVYAAGAFLFMIYVLWNFSQEMEKIDADELIRYKLQNAREVLNQDNQNLHLQAFQFIYQTARDAAYFDMVLTILHEMLLNNSRRKIRKNSAVFLGWLHSNASIPYLERALSDTDPEVARHAQEAIENIVVFNLTGVTVEPPAQPFDGGLGARLADTNEPVASQSGEATQPEKANPLLLKEDFSNLKAFRKQFVLLQKRFEKLVLIFPPDSKNIMQTALKNLKPEIKRLTKIGFLQRKNVELKKDRAKELNEEMDRFLKVVEDKTKISMADLIEAFTEDEKKFEDRLKALRESLKTVQAASPAQKEAVEAIPAATNVKIRLYVEKDLTDLNIFKEQFGRVEKRLSAIVQNYPSEPVGEIMKAYESAKATVDASSGWFGDKNKKAANINRAIPRMMNSISTILDRTGLLATALKNALEEGDVAFSKRMALRDSVARDRIIERATKRPFELSKEDISKSTLNEAVDAVAGAIEKKWYPDHSEALEKDEAQFRSAQARFKRELKQYAYLDSNLFSERIEKAFADLEQFQPLTPFGKAVDAVVKAAVDAKNAGNNAFRLQSLDQSYFLTATEKSRYVSLLVRLKSAIQPEPEAIEPEVPESDAGDTAARTVKRPKVPAIKYDEVRVAWIMPAELGQDPNIAIVMADGSEENLKKRELARQILSAALGNPGNKTRTLADETALIIKRVLESEQWSQPSSGARLAGQDSAAPEDVLTESLLSYGSAVPVLEDSARIGQRFLKAAKPKEAYEAYVRVLTDFFAVMDAHRIKLAPVNFRALEDLDLPGILEALQTATSLINSRDDATYVSQSIRSEQSQVIIDALNNLWFGIDGRSILQYLRVVYGTRINPRIAGGDTETLKGLAEAELKLLVERRRQAGLSGARLALPKVNPETTDAWRSLRFDFARIRDSHLRDLFTKDPARADRLTRDFSTGSDRVAVDFSKNLVDDQALRHLNDLARQTELPEAMRQMFSGEKINETENRAVLHTALRMPADRTLIVDGVDVVAQVHRVLDKMRRFSEEINSGRWKGFSGKPITDVVNIGIGGSDLGPVMVTEALKPYRVGKVNVHFVSNVDATDFVEKVEKKLNPETTLFIVASKTFTTQETMTNAETAKKWFLNAAKDPGAVKKHFVALSTNKDAVEKFGIDSENMFEFWDWVGGRYSLMSAIGLSIAIDIGFDNFMELLAGANDMDEHFKTAPLEENIPVTLGLLSVWYTNFFDAQTHAILPYDQYLHRLPAYLQQASMESNGKAVDRAGNPVTYATTPVIFGEAGTNGQHSFYQLLHQGTQLVPADFIGVSNSQNPRDDHHEKLLANFLAQTKALAFGKTLEEVLAEGTSPELAPYKAFPGNKPTTSILLSNLTPRTLGALIAMYEHQIFVEGIVTNVLSFDQPGVELGKVMAGPLLKQLNGAAAGPQDPSTQGLLSRIEQDRTPKDVWPSDGLGARLASKKINNELLRRQAVEAESRGIVTTDADPGVERVMLENFLAELKKEASQPGSGRFIKAIAISDEHGTIDKFDELILDAIRSVDGKDLPADAILDPDRELEEQLSYWGVSLKSLRGKIFFHNLGDFMDRGPFGIKVFRRSKELVDAGLSDYVVGNHDFWEFMNLQAFHLPWYQGFDFHRYSDDYNEQYGTVSSVVKQHHASEPSTRTKTWWAERLNDYNTYHAGKQKSVWAAYDQEVNGKVNPETGKKSGGLIESAYDLNEHQQWIWGQFRGYNPKLKIEIYTGVRAVGTSSLKWWQNLLADFEDEFEKIKARPNYDAALPANKAWLRAIAIISDIEGQLREEMESKLTEGQWWWRVLDAINYGNYTTAEWWAKDWSTHKDWGTSVIAELNIDRDPAHLVTQSNYLDDETLKQIADFFKANFRLYVRDVYQNVYMHAFVPPIDRATGEFYFTYNNVEYRGAGKADVRSVWEGLDVLARDIRTKPVGELTEALDLVNSWYADNTTEAKVPNVIRSLNVFGPEKLAAVNGFNRLFTAHLPFHEFSKFKSELGIISGFQTAHSVYFTDHGMGERFGSRGGYIDITPGGIVLKGFEHKNDGVIKANPQTVGIEKTPEGQEVEVALFSNPGTPREVILPRLIKDVQTRLKALQGARLAEELQPEAEPYTAVVGDENALTGRQYHEATHEAYWYERNLRAEGLRDLALSENAFVVDASAGSGAATLRLLGGMAWNRKINRLALFDIELPAKFDLLSYAPVALRSYEHKVANPIEYYRLGFIREQKRYTSLLSIPGIRGNVDLLLFENAIHLVPPQTQRAPLLAQFYETLKPGGTLLIGSGNVESADRGDAILLDDTFKRMRDEIALLLKRETAKYGRIQAHIDSFDDVRREANEKSIKGFLPKPPAQDEVTQALKEAGFEVTVKTSRNSLTFEDFKPFLTEIRAYADSIFPELADFPNENLRRALLLDAAYRMFAKSGGKLEMLWTSFRAVKPQDGARLASLEFFNKLREVRKVFGFVEENADSIYGENGHPLQNELSIVASDVTEPRPSNIHSTRIVNTNDPERPDRPALRVDLYVNGQSNSLRLVFEHVPSNPDHLFFKVLPALRDLLSAAAEKSDLEFIDHTNLPQPLSDKELDAAHVATVNEAASLVWGDKVSEKMSSNNRYWYSPIQAWPLSTDWSRLSDFADFKKAELLPFTTATDAAHPLEPFLQKWHSLLKERGLIPQTPGFAPEVSAARLAEARKVLSVPTSGATARLAIELANQTQQSSYTARVQGWLQSAPADFYASLENDEVAAAKFHDAFTFVTALEEKPRYVAGGLSVFAHSAAVLRYVYAVGLGRMDDFYQNYQGERLDDSVVEGYRNLFEGLTPKDHELLKLFILFHDLGILVQDSQHPEISAVLVESVMKRLLFEESDIRFVAWLVRHHADLGPLYFGERTPDVLKSALQELPDEETKDKARRFLAIETLAEARAYRDPLDDRGRTLTSEKAAFYLGVTKPGWLDQMSVSFVDYRLRMFSSDAMGRLDTVKYEGMLSLVDRMPTQEKKIFENALKFTEVFDYAIYLFQAMDADSLVKFLVVLSGKLAGKGVVRVNFTAPSSAAAQSAKQISGVLKNYEFENLVYSYALQAEAGAKIFGNAQISGGQFTVDNAKLLPPGARLAADESQPWIAERVLGLLGDRALEMKRLVDEWNQAAPQDRPAVSKRIDALINEINTFKPVSGKSLSDLEIKKPEFFVGEMPTDKALYYKSEFERRQLDGHYVPEMIFAGSATRLQDDIQQLTGQKFDDTRFRIYGVDIWDILNIAKQTDRSKVEAYLSAKVEKKEWKPEDAQRFQALLDADVPPHSSNLGVGPRQIVAYRSYLRELSVRRGADFEKVMSRQKIVIHINEEVADLILKDFESNGYYGFNPANIFFIEQQVYHGAVLKAEDGRVAADIAAESRTMPLGHGDTFMQLNTAGETFHYLDGKRVPVETPAVDALRDLQNLIRVHRVNDLTKFDAQQVVDTEKMALALYLFAEKGAGSAIELVENPTNQKGGNLFGYRGENAAFQIETMNSKGSPLITDLLNSESNLPYGAMRFSFKPEALRAILDEGLPYYLRFKDGYLYLEAVSGDFTQLASAKSVAYMRRGELIDDFKELKNLPNAVEAASKQDQYLSAAGARLAVRNVEEERGGNTPIRVATSEKFAQESADAIAGEIVRLQSRLNRPVNIVFATGATQEGMLPILARNQDIRWISVNAFHLDEIEGSRAFADYLRNNFFRHQTDARDPVHRIPSQQFYAIHNFIPPAADDDTVRKALDSYTALLQEKGGADIVILGIGEDGHIAYNMPGQVLGKIGITTLSDAAVRQLQKTMPHVSQGQRAYTMGLVDILTGGHLFLLANGASKQAAVEAAFFGPVTDEIPASHLQNVNPERISVIVDEAAAPQPRGATEGARLAEESVLDASATGKALAPAVKPFLNESNVTVIPILASERVAESALWHFEFRLAGNSVVFTVKEVNPFDVTKSNTIVAEQAVTSDDIRSVRAADTKKALERVAAKPSASLDTVLSKSANAVQLSHEISSSMPALGAFPYYQRGEENLWNRWAREFTDMTVGSGQTFVLSVPLEAAFDREGYLNVVDLSAVTSVLSRILAASRNFKGELLITFTHEGQPLSSEVQSRVAATLLNIQRASGENRVKFGVVNITGGQKLVEGLNGYLNGLKLDIAGQSVGFDVKRDIQSVLTAENKPKDLRLFAIQIPDSDQMISAAGLVMAGTMSLELHATLIGLFKEFAQDVASIEKNGFKLILVKPRRITAELRQLLISMRSTAISA